MSRCELCRSHILKICCINALKKLETISEGEVSKALMRMKNGKPVGPSDILGEVWKCLGEREVEFLTNLFKMILDSGKIPEEWKKSILAEDLLEQGGCAEL